MNSCSMVHVNCHHHAGDNSSCGCDSSAHTSSITGRMFGLWRVIFMFHYSVTKETSHACLKFILALQIWFKIITIKSKILKWKFVPSFADALVTSLILYKAEQLVLISKQPPNWKAFYAFKISELCVANNSLRDVVALISRNCYVHICTFL